MILIAESMTMQTEHGEITQDGKIHGIEKVTPNEFRIAANAEIIMPYAAPGITSGSRGNEGNNFCCADHIHPYSSEWKNDEEYQNLNKIYDASIKLINQSNAIKGYDFAKKIFDSIGDFSAILAVMIAGSAPFLAAFAVLMIKIIEIMSGFNLDFEIDIDGVMMTSEKILEILKEIYG